MEWFIIIFYFVIFILALILSFSSIKYFITMWKYKKRKEDPNYDEEKDDEFKRFD